MRIASRKLFEGKLDSPSTLLFDTKNENIQDTWRDGKIYGEKNANLLPFIPHLIECWNSKIVFIVRDGRDVVRSLMDWHDLKVHNIFISKEDGCADGPSEPEDDPWDYSRLRPSPDDAVFEVWKGLDRFEKCAWHWANYNKYGLEILEKIPKKNWIVTDVSRMDMEVIEEVFWFLDLKGFNAVEVERLLNQGINSTQERVGKGERFPRWPAWTDDLNKKFEAHAGFMLRDLKYV